MAQTTCATMFVWIVLALFWHFDRKKKEEERTFTSTRPVGFAAGKKAHAGLLEYFPLVSYIHRVV